MNIENCVTLSFSTLVDTLTTHLTRPCRELPPTYWLFIIDDSMLCSGPLFTLSLTYCIYVIVGHVDNRGCARAVSHLGTRRSRERRPLGPVVSRHT